MISTLLKHQYRRQASPKSTATSTIIISSALTAAAAALFATSLSSFTALDDSKDTDIHGGRQCCCMGIIESNLMDKIANKRYLNYNHNNHIAIPAAPTTATASTIRTTRTKTKMSLTSSSSFHYDDGSESLSDGGGRSDKTKNKNKNFGAVGGVRGSVTVSTGRSRPRGVPFTLRILVIDLPEFRNVFDTECIPDLGMVYPDGIAPPKKINRKKTTRAQVRGDDEEDSKKKKKKKGKVKKGVVTLETMEVVQKSLVKSLSRCGVSGDKRRGGVELLEASISDLNPMKLQRHVTLVRRREDSSSSSSRQRQQEEDDDVARITFAEEIVTGDDDGDDDEDYEEKFERRVQEAEAPWNQYAWAEEMRLRVSGQTKFDEPMESGSFWSRLILGNVYRRTTHFVQNSFLTWFLPWNGRDFGHTAEGIDGDYDDDDFDDEDRQRKGGGGLRGRHRRRRSSMTVACNKPHAVIANGEAMRRVPGSLRELLRCCRNSNVPLYIVNDPRIWGSNTHNDIASAALAIRRTVKDRIISSALQLKESSINNAFQRGRKVGKLEANLHNRLVNTKVNAQRAIRDARRSLQMEDWSHLSQDELRKELIKHKVITVLNDGGDGDKDDSSSGRGDDENESYECSENFLNLCTKLTATRTHKIENKNKYDGTSKKIKVDNDERRDESFPSDSAGRSSSSSSSGSANEELFEGTFEETMGN